MNSKPKSTTETEKKQNAAALKKLLQTGRTKYGKETLQAIQTAYDKLGKHLYNKPTKGVRSRPQR